MEFATFSQIFSILLGFLRGGFAPDPTQALSLYGPHSPTGDGTSFVPLRNKFPATPLSHYRASNAVAMRRS